MIRAAVLLVAAAVAAAAAACHRAPPRVEKCSDDLSGTWRAESDARMRYHVTDGGGRVVLEPLFAAGGAGTQYGAFRIVLDRNGKGALDGAAETTFTENGKTCPVRFHSRIDSCAGGRLALAGETQFDVNMETCQANESGTLSVAYLVREPR